VSLTLAAFISISGSLGYALPAIIGLESMGVPSPGETALVLAAVLASQGRLQIWLVLVIGISSAIIGDNIGYWLGRWLGRDVLTAKGPLQAHRRRAVDAGDRFFDRHGNKAVFFGRWIALVRFAAAWLAGINHMPWPKFLLFNAAGGVLWAALMGTAAYAFSNTAAQVGGTAGFGLAVLATCGMVGLGMVLHRKQDKIAGAHLSCPV